MHYIDAALPPYNEADPKYALLSHSFEEGTFGEFIVNDEEFNVSKLFLICVSFEEWQYEANVIIGAFYGNIKSDKFLELIEEELTSSDSVEDIINKLPKDVEYLSLQDDDSFTEGKGVQYFLLKNAEIISEE